MKIFAKLNSEGSISNPTKPNITETEEILILTKNSKNKGIYRKKLSNWFKSNWLLLLIWVLALVLRIISAIFSKGFIHPDEHYQSIEIIYNKIFGYGVIPWEFVEGARSWVYPGIVFIIFKIMIAFGATKIETMIIGVRLFSGIISMISVIVAYYFGKHLYGRNAGLFASFFIGVWYDFIFWSTRTLADDLAMNFTFLATFLIYTSCSNKKINSNSTIKEKTTYFVKFTFAGMSIGIAYMFKFASAIIAFPLLIYILFKKNWWGGLVFCTSILFMVVVQGIIDLFTWGSFLHSSIVFFEYNILSNSSANHGTAPFYTYPVLFIFSYSIFTIMYILYLILGSKKDQKTIFLLGTSLFFILAFSFIGHKEYRFILPVLPLLALVAAKGMKKYPDFIKKKKIKKGIHVITILLICTSSILTGLFDFSFQPRYNYCQAFEYISQQEEITTIIIVDDIIFYTPGYAYLGKELEIDDIWSFQIEDRFNRYRDSSVCFFMKRELFDSDIRIQNVFEENNITCVFSSFGTVRYVRNVEICVFQKIIE